MRLSFAVCKWNLMMNQTKKCLDCQFLSCPPPRLAKRGWNSAFFCTTIIIFSIEETITGLSLTLIRWRVPFTLSHYCWTDWNTKNKQSSADETSEGGRDFVLPWTDLLCWRPSAALWTDRQTEIVMWDHAAAVTVSVFNRSVWTFLFHFPTDLQSGCVLSGHAWGRGYFLTAESFHCLRSSEQHV